ncbi:MAG: hypothetical protein ISS23_02465 [Nanoarchaeota archaeon]|nr:hypothetical protein [Nanoarchaeota archaeon]
MRIIELEKKDIEINLGRLYRRVMVGGKEELPGWLLEQIEECLDDIPIEPKCIFSFFDCKSDLEKNLILKNESFQSSFLAKRFRFAEEIGLFISTVGYDATTKSRQAYEERDGVKSLIYDSIGSEYAESTADKIQKIIEDDIGYCIKRYSPGYNDWHISEQEKIFKLIPGKEIGVILQENSFLMQPEKSISAIIGYSDKKIQGCISCNQKDCDYKMK